MKFSRQWLQELVDLSGYSTEELANRLTFAGVEVEEVAEVGGHFDHVVVAQILSSEPHPNADRLSVCQVDDGGAEPRQIVCGAKNYQVGDKVPLAQPGAVLPGNFKIKVGKLRGVESKGMLCSAVELKMSEEADGLLILPADSPVGHPFAEVCPPDTIFDVEITPNRPDWLSYRGMARELAALTGHELKVSRVLPEVKLETSRAGQGEIQLETPGCDLYSALHIDGVSVGESPAWLAHKLESVGLRPINQVVDITNYVLMETGQPLHAFDADAIEGALVVRAARGDEIFVALDGQEYSLEEGDVVIADARGVLALGGIMGGAQSGVTGKTKRIILESAHFDPAQIRRTARRLGLITDSSYRFERGVDRQQVLRAAQFASRLIAQLAGGVVAPAIAFAGELDGEPVEISLPYARVTSLLDLPLGSGRIDQILQRLGLEKRSGDAQQSRWRVPSYRLDLKRPVDLIEEVVRVEGLEEVPSHLTGRSSSPREEDFSYDAAMAMRRELALQGLFEARSYALVSEEEAALFGRGEGYAMANPMSQEQTHLRPSLLPRLLAAGRHNVHAGASSVRLFEIGKVFHSEAEGVAERQALALFLSGAVQDRSWQVPSPADYDFYALKAILSALCRAVEFRRLDEEAYLASWEVHSVSGLLGWAAQLLPSEAERLDFSAPVLVAELDLGLLTKERSEREQAARFIPLPRFPAVSRDIALEVDRELPQSEVEAFFAQVAEPLLESVELFDVFFDPSGEKLESDKKSFAYSLTYRDKKRTLSGAEVDEVHQKMMQRLTSQLPVKIR